MIWMNYPVEEIKKIQFKKSIWCWKRTNILMDGEIQQENMKSRYLQSITTDEQTRKVEAKMLKGKTIKCSKKFYQNLRLTREQKVVFNQKLTGEACVLKVSNCTVKSEFKLSLGTIIKGFKKFRNYRIIILLTNSIYYKKYKPLFVHSNFSIYGDSNN